MPMELASIERTSSPTFMDVMANFEVVRTTRSGEGVVGESSQGDNHAPPRDYTYKEFMICRTKSLYGNEGVVGLTRWIEKMESVLKISFCTEDCKVKFSTCTLADASILLCNSYTKTIGSNI